MTKCSYPNCMRLYGGCGFDCPKHSKGSPSDVLMAAHVSSTGKTITIQCDDHDTKDAIMNLLTGVYGE